MIPELAANNWVGGLMSGELVPSIMGVAGSFDGAIKVRMISFGPLAEKIGNREIHVSIGYGSTINQLVSRFNLEEMVDSGLKIALDGIITTDLETKLHDSAEVALLPPVSGG